MSESEQDSATSADRPLCFVLMPFGNKPDPTGGPDIDFDAIYESAIKPAIETAGLQPIRADEETTGGIIHKPMFERLLLAEFAVADLTTGNANVFYELGVRHTTRPATTVTIFASHQPMPFDVNFLRSLPYDLGEKNAFGVHEADALKTALADRLGELRRHALETDAKDSPVFQLLGEWKPGDVARIKTDVFRDRVDYNQDLKAAIAVARSSGDADAAIAELRAVETGLQMDAVEAGVLVDLFLSYRDHKAWNEMIALYEEFPAVLKRQILCREQLAFAYNRRSGLTKNKADRSKALELLEAVETEQGPSSETCGLIGRIHKDDWSDALEHGDDIAARGHLKKAIQAYERGFQADWRDAYPGINAVTLLEISGDDKSLQRKDQLLPVVGFAVNQRLESSNPDYWDHATLLELAILGDDKDAALDHLADALAVVRAKWEPETTANNLKMIIEARVTRHVETDWIKKIVSALDKHGT